MITPEQKAKYEEAAKAHYPDVRLNSWEGARAGFVAGASFAEKENETRIKELISDRDYWKSQAWELLNEKKKEFEKLKI